MTGGRWHGGPEHGRRPCGRRRSGGRGWARARQGRAAGRLALLLSAGALVLGGLAAVAALPFVAAQGGVGPGDVRLTARWTWGGDTVIDVPPLGRVVVDTHDSPLEIEARVTKIDLDRAGAIAGLDDPVRRLEDDARVDVAPLVVKLVVESLVVAALGRGGGRGAPAAPSLASPPARCRGRRGGGRHPAGLDVAAVPAGRLPDAALRRRPRAGTGGARGREARGRVARRRARSAGPPLRSARRAGEDCRRPPRTGRRRRHPHPPRQRHPPEPARRGAGPQPRRALRRRRGHRHRRPDQLRLDGRGPHRRPRGRDPRPVLLRAGQPRLARQPPRARRPPEHHLARRPDGRGRRRAHPRRRRPDDDGRRRRHL